MRVFAIGSKHVQSVSAATTRLPNARGEPVNLLPLTESERSRAREKATAARAVRAEVKARLKRGEITVGEVIHTRSGEEAIGRLKVLDLLRALPGIGEVRAQAIMDEVGIALTRRVRGLGIHQKKALVAHLSDQSSDQR